MTVTDEFRAAVGERLRDARVAANLRQLDVALALQIGTNRVSEWERGQSVPHAQMLSRLASLFGVSVESLIPSATVTTVPVEQDCADVQSGDTPTEVAS